jgi:hypothetical protein
MRRWAAWMCFGIEALLFSAPENRSFCVWVGIGSRSSCIRSFQAWRSRAWRHSSVVRLGAGRRELLPRLLEVGSRVLEGLPSSARLLARVTALVEAAAPTPLWSMSRHAGRAAC